MRGVASASSDGAAASVDASAADGATPSASADGPSAARPGFFLSFYFFLDPAAVLSLGFELPALRGAARWSPKTRRHWTNGDQARADQIDRAGDE